MNQVIDLSQKLTKYTNINFFLGSPARGFAETIIISASSDSFSDCFHAISQKCMNYFEMGSQKIAYSSITSHKRLLTKDSGTSKKLNNNDV